MPAVRGQPADEHLEGYAAVGCLWPLVHTAASPRLRSSCSSVVQVLKVNGQPVNTLKDMVAAVAASQEQYLSLDLEYNQVRVR